MNTNTTSIAGDKNVFREAREIARHCTLASYRDALRARVDEAKEAFDRFHISASKRDFEELVAAWTRMLIAIDAASPWVGGPGGGAGKAPVPTLNFGSLNVA